MAPTWQAGNKANKRKKTKRPGSAEASKSLEQNLGRIRRTVMKRPHPSELGMPEKSIVKKKKNAVPLQGAEKRLRTLNKLLRSIEELQQREAAGEELDDAQLIKLDRLPELLEEMEQLMAGGQS